MFFFAIVCFNFATNLHKKNHNNKSFLYKKQKFSFFFIKRSLLKGLSKKNQLLKKKTIFNLKILNI